VACARRAEAKHVLENRRRRRPAPPGLWLGAAGRLVLLAIYATYVWAVFTPPLDVPPEIAAEEYELSEWP
jgi:hypothetical protein